MRRKGFVATRRTLLCSEHFKEEDFDRTGQIVRLRHGVKPSVFNFPPRSQKKEPSKTEQAPQNPEESLPLDPPPHVHQVEPQFNDDHSYALPACPAALKARLGEALARVESLERRERNSMIRERRAKKNMHALLEGLKEQSLINEELRERLDFCSGVVRLQTRTRTRNARLHGTKTPTSL